MIESFKIFWKEYLDICKASGQWMKKHWIGYIILCCAIFGAEFGYIYKDSIKDGIKKLFNTTKCVREENEEEA